MRESWWRIVGGVGAAVVLATVLMRADQPYPDPWPCAAVCSDWRWWIAVLYGCLCDGSEQ